MLIRGWRYVIMGLNCQGRADGATGMWDSCLRFFFFKKKKVCLQRQVISRSNKRAVSMSS